MKTKANREESVDCVSKVTANPEIDQLWTLELIGIQ